MKIKNISSTSYMVYTGKKPQVFNPGDIIEVEKLPTDCDYEVVEQNKRTGTKKTESE